MNEPTKPNGRGGKERRAELVRRTGLCPFCPYNGGENAKRKAKPDRYKNRRKGKR